MLVKEVRIINVKVIIKRILINPLLISELIISFLSLNTHINIIENNEITEFKTVNINT